MLWVSRKAGSAYHSGNIRSVVAHTVALLLITVAMLQFSVQVRAETVQNVTYYHNNIQGTPLAATDEQGRVLWEQEYSPYGMSRASSAEQNQAALNTIDYTGHITDKDAGASLVYMKSRHYDPLIGRFLSVDPVAVIDGVPDSFNRYAYANNNPYRYTDPTGELPFLLVAYWAVTGALTAYDTYSAYQSNGFGHAIGHFAVDATLSAVGGAAIAKTLKFAGKVAKSVPSKFIKSGGGSDAGDFVTTHSQKHMFDASKVSTKSRSQFGQDINVKALADDTMVNPTSAYSDVNSRITKYSKSYDFNISTPDTPTGEMRVFINNLKPNRSTQFPYVPRN